jgi:membrane fusion protein, heavy metal efflux system
MKLDKDSKELKGKAGLGRFGKPALILSAIALVGIGAAYAFTDAGSVNRNSLVDVARAKLPTVIANPQTTSAVTTPKTETSADTSPPREAFIADEAKPAELKSDALGCLVEPSIVVDVSSPVSGLLDRVAVERGDVVTKGQTVASIESRVERASVELALSRLQNEAEIRSAESNQDFARKKHERNENLHRDGVVSAQVREQAETESVLAAERLKQIREQRLVTAQEVQLARSQLSLKTIASPISGLVIERYLSAGERADEKPILKIAQVDPLRVEAIMPAAMFGKVKKGMNAKVQPELIGEASRDAAVILVDKVIDPASNTFRVRLELPNANNLLPSGVRCKINIAQM